MRTVNGRSKTTRPAGFTLIELLVVAINPTSGADLDILTLLISKNQPLYGAIRRGATILEE
jgi:hypothetical protein